MKIFCNCGVHWQNEFEDTLKDSCNFWDYYIPYSARDNFTKEDKKLLWDLLFAIEIDQFWERTKCMLYVNFKLDYKPDYFNHFERFVPGYKDWEDSKKRKFQSALSSARTHRPDEFERIVLSAFVTEFEKNNG